MKVLNGYRRGLELIGAKLQPDLVHGLGAVSQTLEAGAEVPTEGVEAEVLTGGASLAGLEAGAEVLTEGVEAGGVEAGVLTGGTSLALGNAVVPRTRCSSHGRYADCHGSHFRRK
jgi:heterodisulfide reductase subunit A-like polyferredoxin